MQLSYIHVMLQGVIGGLYKEIALNYRLETE